MKKMHAVIIAVVCIALIVGGYVFLMNRSGDASSKDVELTEVQRLITKDLEKNYPATPREVIKTYNEIITCFYNEKYTDKELEGLADQVRFMMDEELLANNKKSDYLKSLKADIADYKKAERTIVSYELSKSNEIEYLTVDKRECAYVKTSYFMKDKDGYSKTYQMYVVRKDDDGNWKILGFYQVEGDASDE